jgi:flagellar assembly factor FliW
MDSHLLGTVPVDESQVFTFGEGLLGFPEVRRFVLVPDRRHGLFWLQSLEHEALTFLLTDPFERVEDFSVDLADGDLRGLDARSQADLAVLAIVTLPREPGQTPTANLQGPVVFAYGSRRARQVVLADSRWGVRWPVELRGRSRLAS